MERKNGEVGVESGGGGTWRIKESERARPQGRSVLEKYFSVFTRSSRSIFLYVYGMLEGKGHGDLLVHSLRCFLALLDGDGLSEAAWEPMSAFIQPDGTIIPICHSYLVENSEGQLLTRAETLSQRKKKN